MNVKGSFVVTVKAEPPHDVVEGVSIGRVTIDKTFSGKLDATSRGDMIAARTPIDGAAGYVAIERVTGTLDGRTGTFVLQHSGTMVGGKSSLRVTVVPESGTGGLRGLSGRMEIQIVDGNHTYELDYDLPEDRAR